MIERHDSIHIPKDSFAKWCKSSDVARLEGDVTTLQSVHDDQCRVLEGLQSAYDELQADCKGQVEATNEKWGERCTELKGCLEGAHSDIAELNQEKENLTEQLALSKTQYNDLTDSSSRRWNKQEEKYQDRCSKHNDLQLEYEELDLKYDNLLVLTDKQIADIRNQYNKAAVARDSFESLYKCTVETVKGNFEAYKMEKGNLNIQRQELIKELAEANKSTDTFKRHLKDANQGWRVKYDVLKAEHANQAEIIRITSEDRSKRVAELIEENDELKTVCFKRYSEIDKLKDNICILTGDVIAHKKLCDSLKKAVACLRSEGCKTEVASERWQARYERMEAHADKMKDENNALEAKLATLPSLRAGYEQMQLEVDKAKESVEWAESYANKVVDDNSALLIKVTELEEIGKSEESTKSTQLRDIKEGTAWISKQADKGFNPFGAVKALAGSIDEVVKYLEGEL